MSSDDVDRNQKNGWLFKIWFELRTYMHNANYKTTPSKPTMLFIYFQLTKNSQKRKINTNRLLIKLLNLH